MARERGQEASWRSSEGPAQQVPAAGLSWAMKWALQPWGPPATAVLPYSALGRRGDVTPSLLRRR